MATMPRVFSDPSVCETSFSESQKHFLPSKQHLSSRHRTKVDKSKGQTRSFLTASLQSNSLSARACYDKGDLELLEILQNNVSGSPTKTFFGVSPPLRGGYFGGAANPLAHDLNWKFAFSSSHSNLEALRELDSSGLAFLPHNGDSHIILGTETDKSFQEDDWSDIEFHSVESGDCEPFSCKAQYFAV